MGLTNYHTTWEVSKPKSRRQATGPEDEENSRAESVLTIKQRTATEVRPDKSWQGNDLRLSVCYKSLNETQFDFPGRSDILFESRMRTVPTENLDEDVKSLE